MVKNIVKKILLKLGYTIIKGDLKKENARMTAPELPMDLLRNCKLYSNIEEALPIIPKNGTISEIGVAYGVFSEQLINHLQPKKFYAIDLFDVIKLEDEPWGKTRLKDSNLTHEEYYNKRMESYIKKNIVEVKKGYSWDVLAQFDDNFFDYIYLDAGHKYEDIVKDIQQISKKIKTNGIIQFNDYTNFDALNLDTFGVSRAVNEFMIKENYEMIGFCLQPNGFYDVIVRKV